MAGLPPVVKRRLSGMYGKLVDKSKIGDEIPNRVQRAYNNLSGFESAAAVRELLGDAKRVLLIGDGGGRDYFYLSHFGKDVVVLDIAPQPVIPRLLLGDVTRGIPFKDDTFDGVVMAEVIEHLFEDSEALLELRRVLSPSGVLVITVPFGNDTPESHVRVHTDKTILRLLQYSGFEVDRLIYKGGGWALLDNGGIFTIAKHVLAAATFALTGKSIYGPLNDRLTRSDFRAGSKPALRHRLSPLYGGFLSAHPSDIVFDVRAINRDEFEDQTPILF